MGTDSSGSEDESRRRDQALQEAEARVDEIVAGIDREVEAVRRRGIAEHHSPETPFLVYRIYDYDWQIVYVGATKDFAGRMSMHRLSGWWIDVDIAVIVTDHFATTGEAAEREAALIAEHRPRHNVAGGGKRKYQAYGASFA